MNYSVLMSVYYKENPEFLKKSIESIITQSIITDDFVIICDGPLTDELNKVIDEYTKQYPMIFNIIRLEKNKGLGNALRIGIEKCKNEIIARMDSDDISHPNRCEQQLKYIKENNVDIISGFVEEFNRDIKENNKSIRKVPETHQDILVFLKNRNPFNHPCVMYKKEEVIKAGNYRDFYLHEDYYLWIRMIINGCKGYNIQNPLLYMRAGNEMYTRRGGLEYFKHGLKFQRYLFENKIIGKRDYIFNIFIRFIAQVILTNNLRRRIYKRLLRWNYKGINS